MSMANPFLDVQPAAPVKGQNTMPKGTFDSFLKATARLLREEISPLKTRLDEVEKALGVEQKRAAGELDAQIDRFLDTEKS